MRVWMSLPDESGCGHYRVRYPGGAARDLGADVEFKESTRMITAVNEGVHTVVGVENPEIDVIVIARPLRRINAEAIPAFQMHGVAVVVDIDDDFGHVHPEHYAAPAFLAEHNRESNRDWLEASCAMADLVTTTTPALAQRYGGHGRVAVLPNYVPRAMLDTAPERPRDGRTVGWAGLVGTHPTDLLATRGGVARACQEASLRFCNIGTGAKVAEQLELDPGTDFEVTGPKELSDYPAALARFDVGIAPLDDIPFNHAKSALKGLEMAACGVPFIASPMPDYKRIAASGVGQLANSANEWRRRVLELIKEPESTGFAMREAVRDHFVLEDNAHLWPEAWERAIANRHRGRPIQRPVMV